MNEGVPGHPDEAKRLILAALLILLREGGGSDQVSFMLPDLLRLLGWPVAESPWVSIERVLDLSMQPVYREFSVATPHAARGRAARITSWRRLVSGYEYYEESESNTTDPIPDLAGQKVTVTFNPDVLPGRRATGLTL